MVNQELFKLMQRMSQPDDLVIIDNAFVQVGISS
jgi:hypothetical protein